MQYLRNCHMRSQNRIHAKPNPAKGMSKSATSAGIERFSRSGGGVARRNNLSLSRVVGKVGG